MRRRAAPPAALAALAALAAGGGCRRPPAARPMQVSAALIGQCAEPEEGGVVSRRPDIHRADRDLDGDRAPETVLADKRLCTREGNCYWNVFARDRLAGCERYVGTIAASIIDRLPRRSEDGFHDLRGWWRLTGGSRVLLQEYRYRHGGYRVVEAMVCRQEEDDRLLCATESR